MDHIAEQIKAGKIFIYPTDTIYGLGCDATNEEAVAQIRVLKKREDKPFSVIPPSPEWILENIDIADPAMLKPGPFTYFVSLKNHSCITPSVRPDKTRQNLGLRTPLHWFTEHIREAGVPFVSTSVNISGMPSMTSLANLDPTIRDAVDFTIYEGPKTGPASEKIDLTKGAISDRF